MAVGEWVPLTKPERSRTYHFPGGECLTFEDVRAIKVSESGTHYLECGDGSKGIVKSSWLVIVLEADAWTF